MRKEPMAIPVVLLSSSVSLLHTDVFSSDTMIHRFRHVRDCYDASCAKYATGDMEQE